MRAARAASRRSSEWITIRRAAWAAAGTWSQSSFGMGGSALMTSLDPQPSQGASHYSP